jgi:hypothetical protein
MSTQSVLSDRNQYRIQMPAQAIVVARPAERAVVLQWQQSTPGDEALLPTTYISREEGYSAQANDPEDQYLQQAHTRNTAHVSTHKTHNVSVVVCANVAR